MRLAQREVQAMVREQRLLWQVVALARRSDDFLPCTALDALLDGTGPVRPVLPVQRVRRTQ